MLMPRVCPEVRAAEDRFPVSAFSSGDTGFRRFFT